MTNCSSSSPTGFRCSAFRDRSYLRLADEGDTSFVDMRARTHFVPHDLGWNARLIEQYLKTLDFELIGIVEA
jgi:hypothetical protein